MRLRDWPVLLAIFVSAGCLVMALKLADKPVDESLVFLIISFWVLLLTCAVALARLAIAKGKDREG
ncbi:hypothetical protein [Amycolatopsis sp. WQ 127309]|uniref:hypothetical protein n=1 Tax=Amycolatopsis sp. WQ 127309 TaxID=2932773 RepID=UPI001FF4B917|nr:hypothetical protein [Amycolatopsis sp. WQ 127309]UOZ10196.1 hypothetical protein MUY22_18815 [Amycolatopsis sp. WQ 127309]